MRSAAGGPERDDDCARNVQPRRSIAMPRAPVLLIKSQPPYLSSHSGTGRWRLFRNAGLNSFD